MPAPLEEGAEAGCADDDEAVTVVVDEADADSDEDADADDDEEVDADEDDEDDGASPEASLWKTPAKEHQAMGQKRNVIINIYIYFVFSFLSTARGNANLRELATR